MSMQEETVIIWEAPKIVPPEFRLYYDDKGHVVTYTCEKLEGKYIVIDALTFAQARQDVRVVDGKLSTVQAAMVIAKLTPSDTDGMPCAKEDMSILVDDADAQKWNLKIYELR